VLKPLDIAGEQRGIMKMVRCMLLAPAIVWIVSLGTVGAGNVSGRVVNTARDWAEGQTGNYSATTAVTTAAPAEANTTATTVRDACGCSRPLRRGRLSETLKIRSFSPFSADSTAVAMKVKSGLPNVVTAVWSLYYLCVLVFLHSLSPLQATLDI